MGAIPKKSLELQKLSGNGVIVGGDSRAYLSLLNLRAQSSVRQGVDRIVFDFGDKEFSGLSGAPGSYHIEYRKDQNQLIITFHQALHWKFENYEVKDKLKKAQFIQSSQFEFDRLGQASVLTLDLKAPVEVRVREIPGEKMAARLMIDLVSIQKPKRVQK